MIETEADKLLSLVNNQKEITAKEAARQLDMKERQIEEWADFLERRGVLNLRSNIFSLKLISKKF